jgi:lipoprotein-anchoring transpeptidase ErfK/SrfK
MYMKYTRYAAIISLACFFMAGASAQSLMPSGAARPYPGDDFEAPPTPDVRSVRPPDAVEPPTPEGGEGIIPPIVPPILKPSIRFVHPKNDGTVYEGSALTVRWQTTGEVAKVRLYYYGDRTRLGGNSRGDFGVLIGDGVANTGTYTWTVPWVDASAFRLRIAALDSDRKTIAADEVAVQFRPREMASVREKTFILISKDHQRLWYVKDGKLKRLHVVSTALGGFWTPTMRPGSYDPQRGAMGKVFEKDPAPTSREYHVVMPWWLQITASGSHGIHATSPRFYDELGGPASHGCVRQHRADAEILYGLVRVGTPVYIF